MNKTILIPILVFLAVFTGLYFVWPKYSQVSDFKSQVEAKEKELVEKEAYYNNLRNLLEELQIYSPAVSAVDSALPGEFALSSLLDFFQRQTLESGLILKSIGQTVPGAEEESSVSSVSQRLQRAYIAVVAGGSVSGLEDFLKKLEKSVRLIEVERLTLRVGAIGLPELTLQAKVYHY